MLYNHTTLKNVPMSTGVGVKQVTIRKNWLDADKVGF